MSKPLPDVSPLAGLEKRPSRHNKPRVGSQKRTFNLPIYLVEKAVAKAKARGIKVSYLVEEALIKHLAK